MAVYDLNLTSSLDGLLLSTSGPESGQDGGVSWGGESLSEAFNSTGEFGNMSTPFTQGPGVKRYVYPIMLPVRRLPYVYIMMHYNGILNKVKSTIQQNCIVYYETNTYTDTN